uniref:Uncharacterized protein n=1 Tax=Arundo donax TaxID=35708 RepID=A0A0A9EEZ7_ARUDO
MAGATTRSWRSPPRPSCSAASRCRSSPSRRSLPDRSGSPRSSGTAPPPPRPHHHRHPPPPSPARPPPPWEPWRAGSRTPAASGAARGRTRRPRGGG